MNLQPLGDRVVLKVKESDEKTKSGIVLPDSSKEKPVQATVVAVGSGEIIDGKKVPLELLGKISETYDFHNTAYESLKATVPTYIEVKEFKFYFDFVVEKVKKLNSLWIK